MLAIAANETGWGKSSNAQQQNNLFSLQGDGSNGSRWASYTSPQESFDAIAIYIGNGQVIQAGGGVDKNVNIAPIGQAGNYEFRRAAGAETAIGNAAATQHGMG